MHASRRLRLFFLLLSGAWLPVTITCQPRDAVIDIIPADGTIVVDQPADYYVVDNGGWPWFDFSFWHDHPSD